MTSNARTFLQCEITTTMLASPTDQATIKAGFPPQHHQLQGEAVLLEDLVEIVYHIMAEYGKSHHTATQPNGKLCIAITVSIWPNYNQGTYLARIPLTCHVPSFHPIQTPMHASTLTTSLPCSTKHIQMRSRWTSHQPNNSLPSYACRTNPASANA